MVKIKMDKTKRGKSQTLRRQRVEQHRKLYPLRGRGGSPENQALSCQLLFSHPENLKKESKECQVDTNMVLKHKKKAVKANKKTVESREPPKSKTQEPRKRRLASLNAEAVNSLLLERPEGPPGAKHAKKQVNGSTALEQTKIETDLKQSPATCQNPKQMKKTKTEEKNDTEVSLFAPAPRRLAGLNAAALLKLTSSNTGNKQRLKTDNKGICVAEKDVQPKVQKFRTQSWKKPVLTGGCEVCNSQSFKSKLKLKGSPESHRLTKPEFQSQNMLGYRLKVVKEEQVEAELSPYFCCPPEGSVEYCHRLALFLGQKAYGETKKHPVTSVKHECLVHPTTLAHPALSLRAHTCLCADPCYSSYYVHFAHPGPPTARPLPCTHSPFCPQEVSGAKLLAPSVSHASGVSHSPLCTSVGSPCFHEACGVNSCGFRPVQPVSSRPCAFTTNCSHCSHPVKMEGEDDHSQALLVPSAVPLSGRSSSTGVACLLSSLSDCRHTDIRLKVGKECPQNTTPPNGSLTIGRTRLSQKQPTGSSAGARQKKVSRRRVTNGWRPVGEPMEKEVFIVDQDEAVLRQCYEGVERDGEVIWVRDTVLLRSGPRKKSLPYVAKISSLWADPRSGELMMSLFWYYRPEHTQGGRDPSMHCENEIFASRHQDENSVACIEDRCYVLPLAQYCRFCALVKQRSEGVSNSVPVVPGPSNSFIPSRRLVPDNVDPDLVYLCRHVYDFRYGRILKNLQ